MEVQVSKENICINKIVAEKKEVLFIDSDMIVPDSKPDILSTINTSGNICLYKKEISEDKVKIEGCINTYVMYLPDSKEDNLRGLNCNMDFSENIAVNGVREGMNLKVEYILKDIECKVINGRKIKLKASMEVTIKAFSNEEIEIVNKINNVEDIQTLEKSFNVNSLIGNGKTSVYAKDTFNVDQNDELAEILNVDIKLVDKDMKISYNKILAKAEAKIKIMYLTEDNRIGKITGKIPVVGFIDIQNVSESNICDIDYEIKNMIIKPNSSGENSIYVEIEIEESCMAYENKQINLIQDLYSPTCNLEFSQKKILSMNNIKKTQKNFSIKENINFTDIEEQNLLDVEIIPNLINTEISNSKITYSGELNINFIFNKDNSISSRNGKIPFEVSLDNENRSENIYLETEILVEDQKFEVRSGGEIEGKVDIDIESRNLKNIGMNIIDNVELSKDEKEEEDYDSLILYIAKPGDSLWKIAKKFNSTVEEIARMNGIEDENIINIGQKIYIPKFKYIKKEKNKDEREQVAI